MNAGKVVLGVMIAASAGAILGVLFAPAKGSDTRKRMAQQGAKLAGQGEGHLSRYVGTASDRYDAFKDGTMDWADMGSAPVYENAGVRSFR